MNEQETVQADQNQEGDVKQCLTDKLHGHEIVNCHGAQDGSLGRLLETLSTEVIHENDYKNFRRIYGGLTNNSKCGCGSGNKFGQCCKGSWNLLERSHRNRRKLAAKEKKAVAARQVPKYEIVLSVYPDGSMSSRMLDEKKELPGGTQLEYIFHNAWLNVITANILAVTRHMVMSSVRPQGAGLGQPAAPGQPGGSIISP